MSVGVRYVHKWLFRTIEDVGVFYQGSEIYLISNPGEGLAVDEDRGRLREADPVRRWTRHVSCRWCSSPVWTQLGPAPGPRPGRPTRRTQP